MADVFSKRKRSDVMRRVRGAGTSIEKRVHELARGSGVRLSANSKSLPGAPDLVARSKRVAVFVHGCFWHQHDCPRGSRTPSTNVEYWQRKLERNVRRDRRVTRELRALGWSVVTVWECQLRAPQRVQKRLFRSLTRSSSPRSSGAPRAANDR